MPTAARSSRSASRKSTPMVSQSTSVSNTPAPPVGSERPSKSKHTGPNTEGMNDMKRVQALLEVPALAPKVSFREYDLNSTPNSSTMNMQPLGTLPGPKQKVPGGKGKSTSKTASSKSTYKKTGTNKESSLSVATGVTAVEAAALSPKSEFGGETEERHVDNDPDTEALQLRLQAVFDVALERSKGLHGGKTSRYLEGVFESAKHNLDMAQTVQAVLEETASQEQIDAFNRLFFAVKAKIDNGEYPDSADGNRAMRTGQPTAPQSNASSAAQSPPNGAPSILCDPNGLDLDSLPGHVVDSHDDRYERAHQLHRATQPLDADQFSISAVRSTADQLDTLPDSSFNDQDFLSRKRARSTETLDTLESFEISSEVGSIDMATEPVKKRPRHATRTKLSPAGAKHTQTIPGGPTEAVARITRVGSEAVSDNDDFCTVCGAPGKFLCCDRCPGSFHFFCLNPPWTDPVPEGAWYCGKCTYEQQQHARSERGLFGQLLHNLERRNPGIYSLPKKIKTYFEHVQSGTDGQYLSAADSKPQKRGGNAGGEDGDYLKLVEKNGADIFCFHCKGSAAGGKRIVKCDFCPLYWHLDCTSPPMAVPPNNQRMWRCPAHYESGVNLSRKPRVPKVMETSLNRGHRNNGHIEIDNSDTEAEPEFREHEQDGVVYRLPERGIKLDFIDTVRRKSQKSAALQRANKAGESMGLSQTPRLTVSEWEAVQALSSQFTAPERSEIPLVANIVQELVKNAPPDVQELFRPTSFKSETNSSNASDKSQMLIEPDELSNANHSPPKATPSQLKAMIELCQQMLCQSAEPGVQS